MNYSPTEDDERCGIAEPTSDMATILEEKLKEKEKQLKLAKVAKRLDRLTKAVKHLAERTQVSPKIVEAIERLTTEKEEMAGILECPAEQQRITERLANNRFAALSEEDDEEHGGRPTMTDMRATNRHVAINYDGILARGTRMSEDDNRSIGTTQSAETVKRSNIMPGKAMTRGDAWNVIRERNWVQQTIMDRDKRWCPTCMSKHMSPTERVGVNEYKAKLMDNKNELTWACADSGCTANICIPGTPLKNLSQQPSPSD